MEKRRAGAVLPPGEAADYGARGCRVLEWLKSQGKGYQSRINAILRREMLESVRSAGTK